MAAASFQNGFLIELFSSILGMVFIQSGVRGLQLTSQRGLRRLLTNPLASNSTLSVHRSASSVSSVVSTEWLHDRIKRNQTKNSMRVVDVTWELTASGKEPYEKEHIPTAVFLDMNQCVKSTPHLPRNLPEIDCFKEYVASLGISNDHHLVVYDRSAAYAGFFTAPRVWWLFRLYGHERISVLNGGLLRWKRDNLPVSAEKPSFPKGRFDVKMNQELMRTYADVLANLYSEAEQLVDARGADSFSGDEIQKNPKLQTGHVPGARNVPLPSLVDQKTLTLKSKEELSEAFKAAKVDLSQPLVSSCLTGITACGLALAADVAGKPNVPVYYGSWMEYGQRAPKDKVAKGN